MKRYSPPRNRPDELSGTPWLQWVAGTISPKIKRPGCESDWQFPFLSKVCTWGYVLTLSIPYSSCNGSYLRTTDNSTCKTVRMGNAKKLTLVIRIHFRTKRFCDHAWNSGRRILFSESFPTWKYFVQKKKKKGRLYITHTVRIPTINISTNKQIQQNPYLLALRRLSSLALGNTTWLQLVTSLSKNISLCSSVSN